MNISHLPKTPGVYIMRDNLSKIIYIGKAKNIHRRVSNYFLKNAAGSGWKIPNLTALIKTIDYISCASEREALLIEKELIQKYQPFFNALWKDGKSYPYIKLTAQDDFPRLTLTRRKLQDKAIYFGPYPKAGAINRLLKFLWKIKYINLKRCAWEFSKKNKLSKRKINSCVYYHTSQCPAPCAGKISQKEYLRIVDRIILFFKGDFSKLLADFSKKMKKHSDNLEYEQAKDYRNFIKAINHLSEKVRVTAFPKIQISDELSKTNATTLLKTLLKLKYPPSHIETFDTSSMFARDAVGSSVCFINGEKYTAYYRRYKIKYSAPLKHGSNDFQMIKEIVERRLAQIKKSKNVKPDLFLIDGGKGQLKMALEAMKESGLKIPVISLSKEYEEIHMPREKPLRLERNNEALKLLQRMRDEAHRFAITYHRRLRDEKFKNK
ncbi:MAG: GIY-YIG nuclease family protein [Elusimicrobiota bacterium]|nr:GIY-YIG nuclease family protein [Elusimicrobiota bacterium]